MDVLKRLSLLLLATHFSTASAFSVRRSSSLHGNFRSDGGIACSATTSASSVEQSVAKLKRVLEREYLSFFDPMEREYYAPSVTFDDPLTDLEGVDAYQSNVDMLAGRNLIGSLLFRDASITLHSVTGGDVSQEKNSVSIAPILTRWTLRFTFQALPWSPSPRFSGISRYSVGPGGPAGCQVLRQEDFWDSINLLPGGAYEKVDRKDAIQHFVKQLTPGNFEAPSAGPELPYQTLRIGKGYDVRRYPSYTAVRMEYERRDEAFSAMGSFASGLQPMAPAVFQVESGSSTSKTMLWPLDFAQPGESSPTRNPVAVERATASDGVFEIITVPETVVAIARFGDAIVEPVVRRVDQELREAVKRDGLATTSNDDLMFAQYDAIFSMGQRRSEVHVALSDHPW